MIHHRHHRFGFTLTSLIVLSTFGLGSLSYFGAKKYFGLGKNTGIFMWGCLTRPHENGAFAPCSKYVAQEIVKPLEVECERRKQDPELSQDTIRILEVGAGSGILTRAIVNTIHTSKLPYLFDIVEINNDYCAKLRKEFREHAQINVKCTSVLDFAATHQYDFIISSIPWSIFSTEDLKKIFDIYTSSIKKDGILSYIKLCGHGVTQKILQGAQKQHYQERQALLEDFTERYSIGAVEVKRNIPPVHVYHCKIS